MSPDTLVNTCTTGHQEEPHLTALADGGWVITWLSGGQDGSASGVYQQRYDASGALVGGEDAAGGGWVANWWSQSQDGNGWGVYQQVYDSTGAAIAGETRVNPFTTNDQISQQVTALTGGGWVVTWQSFNQDGGGYGAISSSTPRTGP